MICFKAKEAGKAYIGIEDRKKPIALLGNGSAVTVDAIDSDEESEQRLYAALTQSVTASDHNTNQETHLNIEASVEQYS